MKNKKNYQGKPVKYGFVFNSGYWKQGWFDSYELRVISTKHPTFHVYSYSMYGDVVNPYQSSDHLCDFEWQQDDGDVSSRCYGGRVSYLDLKNTSEVSQLLSDISKTDLSFKAFLRVLKKHKIERVFFDPGTGAGHSRYLPWKSRKK